MLIEIMGILVIIIVFYIIYLILPKSLKEREIKVFKSKGDEVPKNYSRTVLVHKICSGKGKTFGDNFGEDVLSRVAKYGRLEMDKDINGEWTIKDYMGNIIGKKETQEILEVLEMLNVKPYNGMVLNFNMKNAGNKLYCVDVNDYENVTDDMFRMKNSSTTVVKMEDKDGKEFFKKMNLQSFDNLEDCEDATERIKEEIRLEAKNLMENNPIKVFNNENMVDEDVVEYNSDEEDNAGITRY